MRFLETSPYRRRISAAVNLVAIGGDDSVRIEIAADRPRSPDATLVETAAATDPPAHRARSRGERALRAS